MRCIRTWLACLAMLILASACTTVPQQNGVADAKHAYQVAISAMKAGRAEEALNHFLKMTQNYPTFAGPYANLGLLYSEMGQTEKSSQAFDKALTLNPGSAKIYNSAGLHYRSIGRFSDAEIAYLNAINKSNDYPDPALNLAILYDLYLNKPDQAIVYYKRYLAISKTEDQNVTAWLEILKQRNEVQAAEMN